MSRALSTAATGLLAQQRNVEVISNNIANMTTTGFKARISTFSDLLYQTYRRAGTNSSDTGTIVPSGVQVGVGTKLAATKMLLQQGELLTTDNPFDVAVNGKGYFQVRLPDGTNAYTRDGSFTVSADGELVNKDGYVIEPGITIPSDAIDVTINASGEVIVSLDSQSAPSTIGQLELANFSNPGGLDPIGDNLLKETTASGTPTTGVPASAGFGLVRQGFLESSNVDIVKSITDLITAQRAYEMTYKIVNAADEMMATTTRG